MGTSVVLAQREDVSAALPLTPTRRRLRHSSATVFLFALMLVAATAWPITPTYAQSDQPGAVASQALTGWKLTWSDEFNGSGQADPTKWVNEVKDLTVSGLHVIFRYSISLRERDEALS